MRLTLHSQVTEHVVVIQCQGRIVAGAEVNALQAELDKHTEIWKNVVLHLAEVDYIDSSGLGALVRAFGALRSVGGSLKLCHVSPSVLRVLEVTKLLSILPAHSSEKEAIAASRDGAHNDVIDFSRTRILCLDTSRDLLAYLRALLAGAGYEVHSASNLADAKGLVNVMKPQLVICGAGILGLPTAAAAIEKFRQSGPNVEIVHLASEFSTTEAGQAGTDLVNRVRSLLGT